MATNTTVCPCRRSASASAASVPGSMRWRSWSSGRCRARPSVRRRRRDALARDRLELSPPRAATPPLARAPRRSRRERVLARLLEAGRQPQQLVLVEGRQACGAMRSAGCPSVSVPVLSTTSVSTCSSRSSASAFLISTPARRAAARADHDRHRRRQPERARAGDDQHRDGVDQRVGQPRLGPQSAQTTNATTAIDDDGRHEPRGDAIGQPLDRRAGSLRLADHPRRSARAACRCRRARRASSGCRCR